MKIQKPGSEALGTRTLSRILPDTVRTSTALRYRLSACSIPAMTMEQKVDVKIINTRTSKNIVPLRDGTQKNIGISFAWAFAHFV
ncbi:hypothetical protein DTO063F5_2397 [Paecilomyces variotii]|nr:hypothetical protein DTO063F5_2397 [Paecilomyces variotii]